MRFLKNKLLKAQEALQNKLNSSPLLLDTTVKVKTLLSPLEVKQESLSSFTSQADDLFKTLKTRKRKSATKASSPMKNIVSNFGRAISNFATSYIAIPYLFPHLRREGVTLDEFVSFVNGAKSDIGSIQGLQRLLLLNKTDEPRVTVFKQIFKIISEVFVKFFSVNWIIHGKVTHKLVYLKYRFNMLRRIQTPEYFTYIKKNSARESIMKVD